MLDFSQIYAVCRKAVTHQFRWRLSTEAIYPIFFMPLRRALYFLWWFDHWCSISRFICCPFPWFCNRILITNIFRFRCFEQRCRLRFWRRNECRARLFSMYCTSWNRRQREDVSSAMRKDTPWVFYCLCILLCCSNKVTLWITWMQCFYPNRPRKIFKKGLVNWEFVPLLAKEANFVCILRILWERIFWSDSNFVLHEFYQQSFRKLPFQLNLFGRFTVRILNRVQILSEHFYFIQSLHQVFLKLAKSFGNLLQLENISIQSQSLPK